MTLKKKPRGIPAQFSMPPLTERPGGAKAALREPVRGLVPGDDS